MLSSHEQDRPDPRSEAARLGAKVRALRRREGAVSQAQLAERLGISPSYLNLIENNRRPLPAPLLIKLAQISTSTSTTFATDEDARLISRSDRGVRRSALRATGSRRPTSASSRRRARRRRAVLALYRALPGAARGARRSRTHARRATTARRRPLAAPSEEVSDLHPAAHEPLPRARRRRRGALEARPARARRPLSRARPLPRSAPRRSRAHRARGGAERGTVRRFDPPSGRR